MTNDIKISRELAERLARAYPSNITDTATLLTVQAQSMGALEELRALLAAPVVESQEPVAWQYRVSAGPATGWSLWHDGKGEEFRNSYQVETRALYTSPPAPVAVVLPDLSVIREYHDDASIRLDSYADDADMRKSDSAHYRKRAAFHRDQVATLDKVKELNQ